MHCISNYDFLPPFIDTQSMYKSYLLMSIVNRTFFPAQSAFGCMRITKTGCARFPNESKKFVCVKNFALCFSNSHTSECGLRRKERPIELLLW